jgi:hypothetical protein
MAASLRFRDRSRIVAARRLHNGFTGEWSKER